MHRTSMVRGALGALLVLLGSVPLAAQQRPTNLQVLPDSISRDELIGIMRSFSLALGVRCSHCHVEVERDGRVERDMASDAKPEKRVAREMLRMVGDINARLATLPERAEPNVAVRCATCHRGARLPRTLEDTLMVAYHDGGISALTHTYRELRARHFGRALYDFGPMSLTALGGRLVDGGMPADAAAVYRLNLEMYPEDATTHASLGEAKAAAGDTAAALVSLRRALELDPRNRDVAETIERLEGRAP